jgi:hypothetical protein
MPASIATQIAARTAVPATVDGGKKRVNLEIFNFASDAQGAYNVGALIPRGARITSIKIMSSVTLGTSTIALGIAGTAGKYRAAATYTTPDVWTELGAASALMDELAAEEQLILTVGVAALPASGRLHLVVEYVDPT